MVFMWSMLREMFLNGKLTKIALRLYYLVDKTPRLGGCCLLFSNIFVTMTTNALTLLLQVKLD